jgi:hypothetical protein
MFAVFRIFEESLESSHSFFFEWFLQFSFIEIPIFIVSNLDTAIYHGFTSLITRTLISIYARHELIIEASSEWENVSISLSVTSGPALVIPIFALFSGLTHLSRFLNSARSSSFVFVPW